MTSATAKKLNFVSRNFYPDCPGGCEKVFYEVYKRASKEFNVRIISGYNKKSVFPKPYSIFRHLNVKSSVLRYIYYSLNMSLRSLFHNCDLVHANNVECLRLSGKPFVMTIHHVKHFIDEGVRKQTFFNKMMGKLLVWSANNADKVITVSRATKKDLETMGVKPDKIAVIPNGVDLDHYKPMKRKKNKKFVISHISRISPEKAQHFTIKAFENLPENIKKNIELHIIGYVSDKDYYKVLYKGANIRFFTNVSEEEMPKLINGSDLVVFPTMMSEGFGLVVLESLACGVPVLSSEQESIKEAGGKVCQYFKQGDLKDFTEKLLKLYKDKGLRESLSRKGLAWVKKFDWNSVYAQHKKIYDGLIKK